jgi:AraC family transcriptional regulator
MKTITRESYAKRIERVTEFLLTHLDQEIDLHRLAEEAHLSAYHFHRVYHGMTGETIKDTTRRVRLHRAAVTLITSEATIAAIAKAASYSTVQAFNRAFNEAYNITPAQYRSRQAQQYPFQRNATVTEQNMHEMYEVTIRHIEPQRVAALAHHGDYMEIGASFEKIMIWAAGQNLLNEKTRSFGIYYDDPAAIPTADRRSEACLAIAEDITPPAPYRAINTPGGRCAVLVFKGPYSSLEAPYKWLYGEWLPKSGEEPADAPSFEEYLNDARTTPPSELLTAICMPLKG